MRGSTNAVITPYTVKNTVKYSYDGVIWRSFKSDGTDKEGCASVDFNNNIIQINTSGYDMINEEKLYDTDGGFYIKFLRACQIQYCLVGGGGGGSGGGASGYGYSTVTYYGGGGGAGGEVVYNTVPIQEIRNAVYKIQIGTGGKTGGGNKNFQYANLQNKNPEQGKTSYLYSVNQATNEETLIQSALGGNGAQYTAFSRNSNDYYTVYGSGGGGAGTTATLTNNVYRKSSNGGNGQRYTGGITAGGDGTQWPGDGLYYGGGGGGATNDSAQQGASGGAGGGGNGGHYIYGGLETNPSDGYVGQPNTGGGGGGGSPSNYSGAYGGSGVCLIKFG